MMGIARYQKRRTTDYRTVFETPQGQRVLEDLVGFCCPHATSFRTDPLEMARNEGRREVWLHIHSILNLDETTIRQLAAGLAKRRSEET